MTKPRKDPKPYNNRTHGFNGSPHHPCTACTVCRAHVSVELASGVMLHLCSSCLYRMQLTLVAANDDLVTECVDELAALKADRNRRDLDAQGQPYTERYPTQVDLDE